MRGRDEAVRVWREAVCVWRAQVQARLSGDDVLGQHKKRRLD